MQIAMGAMAAASQSRGVALGSEAGHLLMHLLPLPDGLVVPTASGDLVTVEIRLAEQVGCWPVLLLLTGPSSVTLEGSLALGGSDTYGAPSVTCPAVCLQGTLVRM